ncbi:MAG: DsbA family protein [Microgenomates group bacterium]
MAKKSKKQKELVTYVQQEELKSIDLKPIYFLMGVLLVFNIFLAIKVFNLEKKLTNPTVTTQQRQQQAPEVKIDQVKKLFSKDFIHFGDANRKLLFVEVSDPSCPFCHIAGGLNPELAGQVGERFKYQSQGGAYVPPVPEMKKLVDQGKASFAFIYSNGHGNGELAAQALYCAYEKGKFWEIHDRLMTNEGYTLINEKVRNDKANISELVNFLANEIDANFLKNCLESEKYKQTLVRDQQLSPSLGFQGTPHFLVNTQMFQGAYSFTDMKSVIDKNL